jgi:MFS family permease
MATIGVVSSALSDHEHQVQLRRAVIASTIGTAIEWYDFFLYSVVTGLVFAKLFFPNSDPLVGTLEAFGIYAVGFIARPIGAAIFGHYGGRIGRKSTLIATLMIMGVRPPKSALLPAGASASLQQPPFFRPFQFFDQRWPRSLRRRRTRRATFPLDI